MHVLQEEYCPLLQQLSIANIASFPMPQWIAHTNVHMSSTKWALGVI